MVASSWLSDGAFKVSLKSPDLVYTQKLYAAIKCSILVEHNIINIKVPLKLFPNERLIYYAII